MTLTRAQIVMLSVALVLVAVAAFFGGRSCAPPAPVPITTGIDAGPGERQIADRLDAQIQVDEAKIHQVEQQYQVDTTTFDEHQRNEYERVKGQGLEAIAAYLNDWNRQRRASDGGL